MRRDDGVADRQPNTHPGLFRRHEGLEQLGLDLIGKPRPIVDHANLDVVVRTLGAQGDFSTFLFRDASAALRSRFKRTCWI